MMTTFQKTPVNSSDRTRTSPLRILKNLAAILAVSNALHAEPEPAPAHESLEQFRILLDTPNLSPGERTAIIEDLEAERDALMSDYIAEYRRTIRENHKLHPQDPWAAAAKTKEDLGAQGPLIEHHNHAADLLDQHAPVILPDAGPHLDRLPPAYRNLIEGAQASLHASADSFDEIAAAQERFREEIAKNPASYAAGKPSKPSESPEREAHLRRVHKNLLMIDPGNTPPLAEFLRSQRFSILLNPNPFKTNPEKQ